MSTAAKHRGDAWQRWARRLYYSIPRPLRRVLVLLLGAMILVAGLAMLVLPGPGLLVIGVAIALLALEFQCAKRLADQSTRVARRLGHSLGLSRSDPPGPQ